eukprot:14796641-Alexandrium_andersonii.AAC.1
MSACGRITVRAHTTMQWHAKQHYSKLLYMSFEAWLEHRSVPTHSHASTDSTRRSANTRGTDSLCLTLC